MRGSLSANPARQLADDAEGKRRSIRAAKPSQVSGIDKSLSDHVKTRKGAADDSVSRDLNRIRRRSVSKNKYKNSEIARAHEERGEHV
jgi:hypothetical protein